MGVPSLNDLAVDGTLNTTNQKYLSEIIKVYTSCRPDLRSANPDPRLLERQDNRFTTKSYGWRAFYVCAPILWNDLPVFLKNLKM